MHSTLGDSQPWGTDEVRILTSRGWIVCRLGGELQEERNKIESINNQSRSQ